MELWCDADFCGNWSPETEGVDKTPAKSRTGYIITYVGCPLTWTSKLQTETALSTTEVDFIDLSEGLRTAIPIMNLIDELKDKRIELLDEGAKVRCKIFEDNSGAKVIASVPRICPRTKHLNIKFCHFTEYVEQGRVRIHSVKLEDQLAEILTKPLPKQEYERLIDIILGDAKAPSTPRMQGSVMDSR